MENVNLNNKLEQIIKALIDLCAMTRELESSKDLFYTGYLEGIEKNKELEKENNELKQKIKEMVNSGVYMTRRE